LLHPDRSYGRLTIYMWCFYVGKVNGVVTLSLVLSSCFLQVSAEPVPPDPDQAIGRSLSIIRSATAEKPQVLKILFYGQSISSPAWTDPAIAALRVKYPNVAFVYRNLALGVECRSPGTGGRSRRGGGLSRSDRFPRVWRSPCLRANYSDPSLKNGSRHHHSNRPRRESA
jgi:hypothetical protein